MNPLYSDVKYGIDYGDGLCPSAICKVRSSAVFASSLDAKDLGYEGESPC